MRSTECDFARKIAPAVAAVLLACSETNSSTTESGGGTLIPWNADLVRVSAQDSLFAATVVGLTDVELVRGSGEDLRIEVLASPPIADASAACPTRSPVSLASGNFDQLDEDELLVQDPCGSWVSDVASGVPQSLATIDALPAHPYGETVLLDDRSLLAFADLAFESLSVADPTAGIVTDTPLEGWAPPAVTRPIAASSGITAENELLLQRKEAIVVVPVNDDRALAWDQKRTLTQEYQRPYVAPFAAYDSLTPVRTTACGAAALGVGIFDAEAGEVPRRAQLLRLSELSGDSYISEELPIAEDVLTLGAVTLPWADALLAGIISRRQGVYYFAALALRDCTTWTELGEIEIDFDVRTAPMPPSFGGGNFIRTDHIKLVTVVDEATRSVRFYHYDGYSIRVLRVDTIDDGATLTETLVPVHARREDLAGG